MRTQTFKIFLATILALVGSAPALAQLSLEREISIEGSVHESRDLSGAVAHGPYLVVGSDEGDSIQVLEPTASGYRAARTFSLRNGGELDIEGLARRQQTYYVLGSHSRRRPRVKTSRSYNRNRKNLLASSIGAGGARTKIYRFQLDPGKGNPPARVEHISLGRLFEQHPVLAPFVSLPSKENGIDIEGIALEGERLVLGFRGPRLRGGWVPVLKLPFSSPQTAELLFVHLNGRGIRDMVAVDDGFLVLAGPVGDSPLSFQLYHWNGRDCLPGKGSPGGRTLLLGEVPAPAGASPEALVLLETQQRAYRLLLLDDGIKNGRPRIYRIER